MDVGHLILDRDGVLNREPQMGWVFDRDAWRWEAGALDALAGLGAAGIEISIATNQSCIGRGLTTLDAVDVLHQWALAEATRRGARIARVFVCPHVEDDRCACRKPKPGLLARAIAASEISIARTLVIGDSRRDLEAARVLGLAAALVRTGKGRGQEASCRELAAWIFDDLSHATDCILGVRPFPSR